jgi:hypothetical protein
MLNINGIYSDLPEVKVAYLNRNSDVKYKGKIIRFLSNVDEKGLMATFLISVKNPLNKKHAIPLLLGSQVKVEIKGKSLKSYYKLPRYVNYNNNSILLVYIGKLETRKVNIEYTTKDWVFIKEGIKENEKIIFSRVPAPINQMPVKIIKEIK